MCLLIVDHGQQWLVAVYDGAHVNASAQVNKDMLTCNYYSIWYCQWLILVIVNGHYITAINHMHMFKIPSERFTISNQSAYEKVIMGML